MDSAAPALRLLSKAQLLLHLETLSIWETHIHTRKYHPRWLHVVAKDEGDATRASLDGAASGRQKPNATAQIDTRLARIEARLLRGAGHSSAHSSSGGGSGANTKGGEEGPEGAPSEAAVLELLTAEVARVSEEARAAREENKRTDASMREHLGRLRDEMLHAIESAGVATEAARRGGQRWQQASEAIARERERGERRAESKRAQEERDRLNEEMHRTEATMRSMLNKVKGEVVAAIAGQEALRRSEAEAAASRAAARHREDKMQAAVTMQQAATFIAAVNRGRVARKAAREGGAAPSDALSSQGHVETRSRIARFVRNLRKLQN